MAKDENGTEGENSSNPLSALLAQQVNREQRVAAFTEWAASMRDFYTALVAAGFAEDQALELTMAFQADTLSQGRDA